jgi:hypothetical protein
VNSALDNVTSLDAEASSCVDVVSDGVVTSLDVVTGPDDVSVDVVSVGVDELSDDSAVTDV